MGLVQDTMEGIVLGVAGAMRRHSGGCQCICRTLGAMELHQSEIEECFLSSVIRPECEVPYSGELVLAVELRRHLLESIMAGGVVTLETASRLLDQCGRTASNEVRRLMRTSMPQEFARYGHQLLCGEVLTSLVDQVAESELVGRSCKRSARRVRDVREFTIANTSELRRAAERLARLYQAQIEPERTCPLRPRFTRHLRCRGFSRPTAQNIVWSVAESTRELIQRTISRLTEEELVAVLAAREYRYLLLSKLTKRLFPA